jgi:hypothetical protein
MVSKAKHAMMSAALVMAAPLASAGTGKSTGYQIDRAWFDAERVYVVYAKDIAKEHYSIRDVHGTIVKEEKTTWIASFPRAQLADGIVLELKAEKPTPSIVYKEKDFSIATLGARSILSGREIDGAAPICEKQEDTGWPIRWRDTIFYCGSLYSLSGHQEWTVPAAVLQAIGDKSRSSSRSALEDLAQRKPVFCMGSGNQFFVASSLGTSATLQLGSWSVGQSEISWRTVPVGPQGAKASVANGVLAYSPNRIVLKVENDHESHWAQCDDSKCDAIGKLNAGLSYLLLDDKAREAIALSIPNLTRPGLLIQLEKL